MSNAIVKYNNDLNYMPLPNFTGRQYDLFFSIISEIKEKHENSNILKRFFDSNKRELVIPYENFVKICRINEWNRSFIEVYKEIETFLNILLEYKISYRTPNAYYAFVCFEEAKHDTIEQTICITFQKKFYNMVVNYNLGFTRFELTEFISLNGKYTKTLYRLLKQYRHTGYMRMEWQEFIRILEIPINYRQTDIDQRILKPAVKELTKERNLFDTKRIPFENLSYKKIKGKGRGRGGNVLAIEFSFKPEPRQQEQENNLELEQKAEQMQNLIHEKEQQQAQMNFGNYDGITFQNDNGEVIKIIDIWQDTITSKIVAKFKNMENGTEYQNDFKHINFLNKYLSYFGLEFSTKKWNTTK